MESSWTFSVTHLKGTVAKLVSERMENGWLFGSKTNISHLLQYFILHAVTTGLFCLLYRCDIHFIFNTHTHIFVYFTVQKTQIL